MIFFLKDNLQDVDRKWKWFHIVLSAVSLTVANNFSAVSLTPVINFRLFVSFWLVYVNDTREKCIAGVIDTGNKLLWWQRAVLSAKLWTAWQDKDAAEDSDISGRLGLTRPPMMSLEPPWKSASIDNSHTLIRGPWSRQKLANLNGDISRSYIGWNKWLDTSKMMNRWQW